MREFYERITVDEALTILLKEAKSFEVGLPFDMCKGMVLSEDIISSVNLPPFDRSAMDGYAIKAEKSFGASQANPVCFKIVGESKIGEFPEAKVGEHDLQAVRIATGAPIPEGCNAVMMVEYTKETGPKTVDFFSSVTPGRNVAPEGEDVRVGDTVLKKGRVLKPHDIGILAGIGKSQIKVLKRPDVAIISTGDELVEVGDVPPGKIIDVNSYTLSELVHLLGVPHKRKIVRDDPDELKEAIKESLSYDLIIVSGGTSVGRRDYLPVVVSEMGDLLFHGVSMRPGQPSGFGVIEETPIFMLPGFPVATMVAFEFLVRPFLQKSAGFAVESSYPGIHAILKRKIASEIGRRDFVRLELFEEEGVTYADPITSSGSGIISSMVKSDGFLIVSESMEGIEVGGEVEVSLF
ncbi:MAG: molybdopterin molybdotransferase MoeA [Halobacteriota archaeon]|nr:molybdopterin molybdotransferase MoeA [Halobacteriota archaeon]